MKFFNLRYAVIATFVLFLLSFIGFLCMFAFRIYLDVKTIYISFNSIKIIDYSIFILFMSSIISGFISSILNEKNKWKTDK